MTLHQTTNVHDDVVWGPNGGRASDVPVVPGGTPNLLAVMELWPSADAPMVDFALYYARRGWHVFPCGRKAPLTPCDKDASGNKIRGTGGFYKASTEEDHIRAWWREFPAHVFGVRAGEASGVFAIDPDGDVGLANWAAIVAKHGDIPRTHAHRTPGGGKHLVFKWHADRQVKCSSGQMKDLKIDVKGQGGYFIAPPSIGKHGKRYEIADPAYFFNFTDAPDWLYELIVKKPTEQPAKFADNRSISEQALAGGPATERSQRNSQSPLC